MPNGDVEGDVGRLADRGDVGRAVLGGLHAGQLAQGGELARRGTGDTVPTEIVNGKLRLTLAAGWS
jgi:hypothetical protein